MSPDPETALAGAVLTRLRADPALKAILGGRAEVHLDPPAEPVYPMVTIGRCESRPVAADGDALETALTLTAVSRFGGAEEARAAAAAVRAALHEADLPVPGRRLVNLRVVYLDVFRGADWRSTYGVVRVRAVTEPL